MRSSGSQGWNIDDKPIRLADLKLSDRPVFHLMLDFILRSSHQPILHLSKGFVLYTSYESLLICIFVCQCSFGHQSHCCSDSGVNHWNPCVLATELTLSMNKLYRLWIFSFSLWGTEETRKLFVWNPQVKTDMLKKACVYYLHILRCLFGP